MEPSFHDQKPGTGSPIKTAVSRSPILPPVNDKSSKSVRRSRYTNIWGQSPKAEARKLKPES